MLRSGEIHNALQGTDEARLMRERAMLHPDRPGQISSRIGAAMLAALLAGAVPAHGELRHTTEYRMNPIKGTTPAELWGSMAARPIIDEDGPALANITHDHKLAVKTMSSGKGCRVDGLDFTWRFVITLPKAVDEAGMSAATRGMWREFTSYLKRHEEHHRTIFLACGKDFLAKAAKITAGGHCRGLERKVRKFVDKQYEACMARQRQFDRDEKQSVAGLALRRAHRK
jgi:predicted secreted Zn-dependent protease